MIAILVLNYNNAIDTINCIDSVIHHNSTPCKFVIIDNGSQDNSVEDITRYFKESHLEYKQYKSGDCVSNLPYVTLISTGKNLGYAQGNNEGLKLIENDNNIDQVLILNNDILFIDDIIPHLSKFLSDKKEAAIVSPLLLKKDYKSIDYNCARMNCSLYELVLLFMSSFFPVKRKMNIIIYRRHILRNHPELLYKDYIQVELPSGSCMLMKKTFLRALGYFDPNTFLYYEENILYKKIERLHMYNYILPHLKCIHLGAQTTSKEKEIIKNNSVSLWSAYYYAMNYCSLNMFQRICIKCLYKLSLFRICLSNLYHSIF